jgi:cytoskeletal protein RodZ
MTKPRISQILLSVLALMALALFGFFVALVAGALPIEEPPPPPDTGAFEAPQSEPAHEPATTAVTKRVLRTTSPAASTFSASTTPSTGPSPALATVVVTASRGDCWISARLGSENGRVLDERLLAQGESVTLRGEKVWISIGAAANVDVTVNGQDREIQSGTVALVLAPA